MKRADRGDQVQMELTRWKVWLLAVRPKTLPAAAAPVILGTFLAAWEQAFRPFPAAATLLCAVLLQIGSNLANDVFDFQRGVDSKDRLGPVRVTQAGLLTSREIKIALAVVISAAALSGLYLSCLSSWWLLPVGLLAVLAAVGYSGGPVPYGSIGLGDLFVFLFFGLAAVGGSYYIQARSINLTAGILGAAMGGLITNILVVNNLRDIETDQRTGKRTLAVTLGREATRVEYLVFLLGAYGLTITLIAGGRIPVGALAAGVTIPWAVRLVRQIYQWEGKQLNQTLAETGQFALMFGLLIGLGGLLIP